MARSLPIEAEINRVRESGVPISDPAGIFRHGLVARTGFIHRFRLFGLTGEPIEIDFPNKTIRKEAW